MTRLFDDIKPSVLDAYWSTLRHVTLDYCANTVEFYAHVSVVVYHFPSLLRRSNCLSSYRRHLQSPWSPTACSTDNADDAIADTWCHVCDKSTEHAYHISLLYGMAAGCDYKITRGRRVFGDSELVGSLIHVTASWSGFFACGYRRPSYIFSWSVGRSRGIWSGQSQLKAHYYSSAHASKIEKRKLLKRQPSAAMSTIALNNTNDVRMRTQISLKQAPRDYADGFVEVVDRWAAVKCVVIDQHSHLVNPAAIYAEVCNILSTTNHMFWMNYPEY